MRPRTRTTGAITGKQAEKPGPKTGLARMVRLLGPGLITGAADDDPAGIATYSQAGAAFRYGLLWTVLAQLPLMCAVQLTCARIGLVSGRDLAGVIGRHYPRWVLWAACVLMVVADTVTAGADLAGVAAGLGLLTHVSDTLFVLPLAVALAAVLVLAGYDKIRSILKWLALALLAYLAAGILSHPDWGEVLRRTFIPGVQSSYEYLTTFVAVFGTTITPNLFFWQSAEEVEEQKEKGQKSVRARRGASRRELADARADTIAGMTASQVIGYFIIVAAGAQLWPTGHRDIGSAREAAQALAPLGGGLGTVLFALGMIGTGLLAIPTLTGASAYAVAALGGWRAGIDEPLGKARRFYAVLVAGIAAAAILAFTGIEPVALLFSSAVINGVLAPPLLVLVLLIANREEVMGTHRNGIVLNVLLGLATLVMGAAALALAAGWVAAHLR